MIDTHEEAIKIAAMLATKNGKTYFVCKHVGDYGRPGGDIKALHKYAVFSKERYDVFEEHNRHEWAMVSIVNIDHVPQG